MSLADLINNGQYGINPDGSQSGLLSGVSLSDIANTQLTPAQQQAQQQAAFANLNTTLGITPSQGPGTAGGALTAPVPPVTMPYSDTLGYNQNGGQQSYGYNGSYDPTSASAISAAIGSINTAHQNYAASGGSSGYSGSSNSPFVQNQQLTQDVWGTKNGLSPYQSAQAGNEYTPDEYQQIADTQAAGASNQLTNLERNLAWGETGGSGSGGYTSTSGASDVNGYDISAYAADPSYASAVSQNYSTMQSSGVNSPDTLSSYISQVNPNSQISGSDIYNAASQSGVDPLMLASQVQQESQFGNSNVAQQDNNLTGVTWNPGNQMEQQLGATQGTAKPASEGGGYYANFKQPQDSLAWTANYLANNKTNQQAAQSNFQQYGLLSKAPDFNPGTFQGQSVANYLQYYISNQKEPTPSSLGLTKALSYQFPSVVANADKVFYQATGYALPSVKDLQSYQDIFNNNIKVLNNLETSSNALQANAGMMITNLKAGDFNGSNQAVNGITDAYKNFIGDGSMATYLAQNQTVSQELGNLFAVRNASGTTVVDKMSSEGIFNSKQTLAQQQQILSILSKEANNVRDTFVNANKKVFSVTDPFLQNPDNPLREQYMDQEWGGGSSTGSGSTTSGNSFSLVQ